MTITEPLALYDISILDQIKLKHTNIPGCKFLFAPAEKDIGFRLAEEKFGKQIFPIIFIFRNDPAVPAGADFSPAKAHLINNIEDNAHSLSIMNSYVTYQIDGYFNNMAQANLFNISYMKFLTNRSVNFDFNYLNVDFVNHYEVLFEEIESNNTIEEQYTIGRYYHYTYRIKLLVPLFEVSTEVSAESIQFSIYSNTGISGSADHLEATLTKNL